MHLPCTYHAPTMHLPCTYMHMHMPCTYHAHTMHIPCTCHAYTMHVQAKHEAYQKEQAAKPAGGSGPGPSKGGGRKRDASEPTLNPVEKKRTKFETCARYTCTPHPLH